MITFLKVKNRARSSLAAEINDSVTSFDVADGEGVRFPTTYPFDITINDEILRCTDVSTDTLTVTREVQGTTAATHVIYSLVELRITAEHLDDITDLLHKLDHYIVEKDAAYTATSTDYIILVDASTGDITIALPAASSSTNYGLIIKKIDSSGHSVIIDADSTEKIDGEQTIELNLQYSYIHIVCDGDEWHIIGGEYVKMEEVMRENKSLLQQQLILLRILAYHLGVITGEVIKEDDLDA